VLRRRARGGCESSVEDRELLRQTCTVHPVKRSLIRFLLAVCIVGVATAPAASASDPVGDFFKRLGNSIKNAGKSPPKRTSKSGSKRPGEKESPSSSPFPVMSPSPTPGVVVRLATVAPPSKGAKRDLPYAIPVPDRAGFVTSPFAGFPDAVDLLSFRPEWRNRSRFQVGAASRASKRSRLRSTGQDRGIRRLKNDWR
jgi:hypothetical protein